MNFNAADFKKLIFPIAIAIALAASGAALIWYVNRQVVEVNARFVIVKNERVQAREKLARISEEEREVNEESRLPPPAGSSHYWQGAPSRLGRRDPTHPINGLVHANSSSSWSHIEARILAGLPGKSTHEKLEVDDVAHVSDLGSIGCVGSRRPSRDGAPCQ